MWKCPKCGRSFKNENQSHYCGKAPETIDEYILAQDEEIQSHNVFSVIEAYYRRICEYMQFEDCGMVLGGGCGTPSMTRNSGYIEKAYELGKSI